LDWSWRSVYLAITFAGISAFPLHLLVSYFLSLLAGHRASFSEVSWSGSLHSVVGDQSTDCTSSTHPDMTARAISQPIRRLGWEMAAEFCLRNISIHARKVLLHAVNLRHGTDGTALLPLRRKLCYGFLSPLKIHRPRPGSNPLTLGPVASTLTTSPPRTDTDCCVKLLW
jgi:hypothetical protein